MANRTVKDAKSIHGTNPQYLVEKIVRSRVYDSKYWKEECFALSAELVVDKAMELRCIGGIYGGYIKPTAFLCLTLKMLQIQPEKDIVVEFIKNEEFKYVRALGAFYMRLVGTSVDCYKYLEPLFNDNRKLRRQDRQGQFKCVHMDEFIDELLHEERVCDIILPRIQKRYILEENNEIETKASALDEDFDEAVESSGDEGELVSTHDKRYALEEFLLNNTENKRRSVNRNRISERAKDRDRERDRHYRSRYRERSHSRDRKQSRKSPVKYRDENQRKDRKRSPNRDRKHKDRNKDRSHDREKYRDTDKSREKRHRSKSPSRKRKGK